jgi:hypothetical protein
MKESQSAFAVRVLARNAQATGMILMRDSYKQLVSAKGSTKENMHPA